MNEPFLTKVCVTLPGETKMAVKFVQILKILSSVKNDISFSFYVRDF